jgi:hypothetical protein
MFLLNGQPLAPDTAFSTPDGTQYPANFLRLSTLEEKEAIGITEVPDPAPYDQRFAWGVGSMGQPIWKDHAPLVEQWTAQTRATAGSLLSPTDWLVIRELDNGTPMPAVVKAERQSIRNKCSAKITAITATTDTAGLAAYVTGADYNAWVTPADGLESADDGESS